MNDSGRRRIKRHRARLKAFLCQADARRLSIDISKRSHGECASIMFGNRWMQLMALFRFVLFQSISPLPFSGLKNFIYRRFGMHVGQNVYISPYVYIDVSHPELIQIDDNVIVGMGAALVTHERSMTRMTFGRVHICENCCIGGKTIIRCGVTVGADAIVDMLQNVRQNVPDGMYVRSADSELVQLSKDNS